MHNRSPLKSYSPAPVNSSRKPWAHAARGMFISTLTSIHVSFESNINSLSLSRGCQTALEARTSASVSQLEKKENSLEGFTADRPVMIPETNLKLIPPNSALAAEERFSRSQIIHEPGGIRGIIYAHHVLRWIFLFNTFSLLQVTCSSPGWRSKKSPPCISWYLSYYSLCLWKQTRQSNDGLFSQSEADVRHQLSLPSRFIRNITLTVWLCDDINFSLAPCGCEVNVIVV